MSTSPTTKQAFNHLTSLATEISEWAKTERNLDEIGLPVGRVCTCMRIRGVALFVPAGRLGL